MSFCLDAKHRSRSWHTIRSVRLFLPARTRVSPIRARPCISTVLLDRQCNNTRLRVSLAYPWFHYAREADLTAVQYGILHVLELF